MPYGWYVPSGEGNNAKAAKLERSERIVGFSRFLRCVSKAVHQVCVWWSSFDYVSCLIDIHRAILSAQLSKVLFWSLVFQETWCFFWDVAEFFVLYVGEFSPIFCSVWRADPGLQLLGVGQETDQRVPEGDFAPTGPTVHTWFGRRRLYTYNVMI
jgi:hypothetical protein